MDVQRKVGADYRVVLLYSKEKQTPKRHNGIQGQMVSYYDELKVKEVPLNDGCPSLQDAYKTAADILKKRSSLEARENYVASFPQALITCTEYSISGQNSVEGFHYTKQDIDSFWNNRNYGLFFMTMFHRGTGESLSEVFQDAQEHFRQETCLVYLSFDQSDILVFGKSNSYKNYAKKVFEFDYGQDNRITDSITLWSFGTPSVLNTLNAPDDLWAHFRFGTQDYKSAASFAEELCKGNTNLDYFCSLGRNDMAVVNRQTSLKWVYNTWKTLCQNEWCTTFDLCLLIPHLEVNNLCGRTAPAFCEESTIARKALLRRLQSFESAYKKGCARIGIEEDGVWLRWLHEVILQASGLLKNQMSLSIGICLTPQIRDLLIYATNIYKSDQLEVSTEQIVKKNLEEIYSNTLILIDSMNHSNRQFVQTPAFHEAAFEMPPKIMAYYTAITQHLIQALKDDYFQDGTAPFYGYTISPRFTNTLSVSSLAVQEIIPRYEFISIAVDEKSLHDLKLTTATLAHEISHYVGWKCRCRDERAKQLICYRICRLLETLSSKIMNIFTGKDSADSIHFNPLSVKEAAEKLYTIYKSSCPQNQYLKDLFEDLLELPELFAEDPALKEKLFHAVLQIIDTYMATSSHDIPFESCLMNYMSAQEGIQLSASDGQKLWNREPTVHAELMRIFEQELLDICDRIDAADEMSDDVRVRPNDYEWSCCSLFRETFADLQMIMLFNLSWNEYCEIIDMKNAQNSDVFLRAVAVGRTLRRQNFPNWSPSENSSQPDAAAQAWQFIQCDNLFSAVHQSDPIDPLLSKYLEDYLACCYEKINTHLGTKQDEVVRLQNIYGHLGADSVVTIQEKIADLILNYKNEMLCSCNQYLGGYENCASQTQI